MGKGRRVSSGSAHGIMHRTGAGAAYRSAFAGSKAVTFVVSRVIDLDAGSAAQDYIQLYEGVAKLFTGILEHIQRTVNQSLNSIGEDESSEPPA